MPFVNIRYVRQNISEGHERRKDAIADRISKAIAEEMDVSPDVVWVVFEEVDMADWYVGPTSVTKIRKQSGK
ncbi:MAG TPA: 4-oxalocrotonate tautomerase family protein [Bauldia sp.]|nr:4-oxalocrotonate tautomerase family protein [Bauldia sp.]